MHNIFQTDFVTDFFYVTLYHRRFSFTLEQEKLFVIHNISEHHLIVIDHLFCSPWFALHWNQVLPPGSLLQLRAGRQSPFLAESWYLSAAEWPGLVNYFRDRNDSVS